MPSSPINCPKCYDALRIIVDHKTEIDVCDRCHGVWLDAGELQRLTSVAEIRNQFAVAGTEPDLSCPRCKKPLMALANKDVEIASCASCNGMFISGALLERYRSHAKSNAAIQSSDPESKISIFEIGSAFTSIVDLLAAIATILH